MSTPNIRHIPRILAFLISATASIFIGHTMFTVYASYNKNWTSLLFFVTAFTFMAIYLLCSEAKAKAKITIICLSGVFLRLIFIKVLRTVPVSDTSIPSQVYTMIQEDPNQNFGWIAGYFSRFPAWYPNLRYILFIYDIFGYNNEAVKYINVLLNAVTIINIYCAVKLAGTKRIALFSAAAYSFCPSLILNASMAVPDHLANFTISMVILLLIKQHFLFKSERYTLFAKYNFLPMIDSRRSAIFLLGLSAVLSALFNLFKPVALYLLIAYLCTEFVIFLMPHLFNHKILMGQIKGNYKKWTMFVCVFMLSYFAVNKINVISIEKMMKVKVVDSSGLYLLWATTVNESGHFDNALANDLIAEINGKHGSYTSKALAEIKEIGISRLKSNLRFIPRLVFDKFRKDFLSEYGYWGFSNTSADKDYVADLNKTVYVPYITCAAFFMGALFMLTLVSFLGAQLSRKALGYGYWLAFFLTFGYTLVLLLGSIQGRYKSIMIPQLSICAAYGLYCLDLGYNKLKKTVLSRFGKNSD